MNQRQILILFLNNLLFEKDTGQNELLICPNCTESDKLVFTLNCLISFWQMKGRRVFGVNTNQAVLLQFDPFRQLSWRAHPFRQLCCGVWEIFSYRENYCFSETGSGPNQHWLGFIFRWKFDPVLGHTVLLIENFPKNLTLYCVTEAGFQSHWNSVSNHW